MAHERGRVLIVRCSADAALKECRAGGSVIKMAKGTAEVVDRHGYVRYYLTKRDYSRFLKMLPDMNKRSM